MTWFVEEGIGEHRAAWIEHGRIIETRLLWPGRLVAGQVGEAVLISRTKGQSRGTARFDSGEEALVDHLPRDASEGSPICLEVQRAAMGERARVKLAQARPTERPICQPSLAQCLQAQGYDARIVHRLPDSDDGDGGWDGVLGDALNRRIDFNGGSLLLDVTAAMTVIDIDGSAAPLELALAAIPSISEALRRLDISGMIGIDFPTVNTKAERRKVDEALEHALDGWPHERTAMNGFGFVQLVARKQRPSLLDLASHSRTGLLARQLLRTAEHIAQPGVLLITCHPALKAKFTPEWLDQLRRRTGRDLQIITQPDIALEGGFIHSASK